MSVAGVHRPCRGRPRPRADACCRIFLVAIGSRRTPLRDPLLRLATPLISRDTRGATQLLWSRVAVRDRSGTYREGEDRGHEGICGGTLQAAAGRESGRSPGLGRVCPRLPRTPRPRRAARLTAARRLVLAGGGRVDPRWAGRPWRLRRLARCAARSEGAGRGVCVRVAGATRGADMLRRGLRACGQGPANATGRLVAVRRARRIPLARDRQAVADLVSGAAVTQADLGDHR